MSEIKTVAIGNNNYPSILRKIKNPPKLLYFKGKLLPNENCFAIVGTRYCSVYGKKIALQIAQKLTDQGLTIVSGLAIGIDTVAHRAVIERKKRTIAVLGTGLDKDSIYPPANIELANRIIENKGCLLSEYPPGTHGTRLTFPERNRVIAGLSLGILVVEAKEKSGSLITASWARNQKRDVFAIPGSIFSANSKGCHYLIKKGAFLTEDADDILKKLNFKKIKKENQKQLNFRN